MSSRIFVRWMLPLTMLVLLFAGNSGRAAEAMKPSDVFLQGFMLLREVRKLEAAGEYAAAAGKCREAGEMYASIARRWPAWQTEMLESRRKKVRSDQRRLQQLAEQVQPEAEGQGPAEGGNDDLELPTRGTGPGRPSVRIPDSRKRPDGIATPPRAATPRQKFQMLQREVERLRQDRARLIRQSQDQADNTAAANRNLGLEREKVANLERALEEARSELERLEGSGVVALQNQVDELTAQLSAASEKLREQNAHTTEVLAAFEESQTQIAELTLQTEDLIQQRDDMAAIIKGLQTGESSLDLITENSRLREQLNAAQARVDELEFEKLEDQAEIDRLREEVSQLRFELATVKKEYEASQQRLLELQGSLEETDQELSMIPLSDENVGAREENELLRKIIHRQLKQQVLRQQKRALIIEELKQWESGSDELVAKIDSLVEETPLSEEESALLGVSGAAPVLGGGDSVDRKIERSAEAAAYNYGIGRYENAATHYEDILQFAPQHVETLCNLGVTKIRLNQVAEARSCFDRAILADAQSGRAHFMHGVASYYLEESEVAVASLKKAVAIEPENAEMVSFLGVIYIVRANWEDAIAALTMAVDLQPRHGIANYNLSYALLQQDRPNPKRALVHYNKAIQQGLAPNEQMENYFRRLQTPETTVPAS